MEETKTAEETLKEKGIKDTLFVNGEWKKKGLSNLMNEFTTQQRSANAELKKQNEESTKFIQMHLDSLDLSNLDFYNKYGFNVAETFPRTREFISKHTT